VGYSYSAASLVLPLILGSLEVEAVGLQAYVREQPRPEGLTQAESLEQVQRLVSVVGADFGVVLDASAERIALVESVIDDDASEPSTRG
jgi:phosphomannomutase